MSTDRGAAAWELAAQLERRSKKLEIKAPLRDALQKFLDEDNYTGINPALKVFHTRTRPSGGREHADLVVTQFKDYILGKYPQNCGISKVDVSSLATELSVSASLTANPQGDEKRTFDSLILPDGTALLKTNHSTKMFQTRDVCQVIFQMTKSIAIDTLTKHLDHLIIRQHIAEQLQVLDVTGDVATVDTIPSVECCVDHLTRLQKVGFSFIGQTRQTKSPNSQFEVLERRGNGIIMALAMICNLKLTVYHGETLSCAYPLFYHNPINPTLRVDIFTSDWQNFYRLSLANKRNLKDIGKLRSLLVSKESNISETWKFEAQSASRVSSQTIFNYFEVAQSSPENMLILECCLKAFGEYSSPFITRQTQPSKVDIFNQQCPNSLIQYCMLLRRIATMSRETAVDDFVSWLFCTVKFCEPPPTLTETIPVDLGEQPYTITEELVRCSTAPCLLGYKPHFEAELSVFHSTTQNRRLKFSAECDFSLHVLNPLNKSAGVDSYYHLLLIENKPRTKTKSEHQIIMEMVCAALHNSSVLLPGFETVPVYLLLFVGSTVELYFCNFDQNFLKDITDIEKLRPSKKMTIYKSARIGDFDGDSEQQCAAFKLILDLKTTVQHLIRYSKTD